MNSIRTTLARMFHTECPTKKVALSGMLVEEVPLEVVPLIWINKSAINL